MSLLSALLDRGLQDMVQAWPGVRDCTSARMRAAIREWSALYYDDTVHDQQDPCQRIPATVVTKLYKACFAEYEAEVLAQGPKGEFLARCQQGLNRRCKQAVQLAMIGGECWLKPVPAADVFGWVVVPRDAVIILGRDADGAVDDMLTAEQTAAGGRWDTLIERRTVEEAGRLTLQNRLYSSPTEGSIGMRVPLGSLPRYAALQDAYTYPHPVGGIGMASLRIPTTNCVDGSADAVAVFAPAMGLIRNINHNEWLMNQEFDLGATRVFASDDLLRHERDNAGRLTGKSLPTGLFTALDEDPGRVGITIFSPTLREQSFLARKTEYLRNVENVLGIKRGLLSEVEAAQRTATEVSSSAGDYSLTIQDLQQMWADADREALRLCDLFGQMYGLCGGETFDPAADVSIDWGNGVLYDAEKTWAEILQMVESGMLKPELALAWKYDLPHDTPADLAKIRADYMPELTGLAGGEV
ncbi:MAG: hypothetical protein ACI4OI_04690 [Gemmiger sp.]